MVGLSSIATNVDFDQCMFKLTPPHLMKSNTKEVYIKKPTRILTNMSTLCQLSQKCDKKHAHFECMGSVRVDGMRVGVASSAGCYPPALCAAWARAVGEKAAEREASAPAAARCP